MCYGVVPLRWPFGSMCPTVAGRPPLRRRFASFGPKLGRKIPSEAEDAGSLDGSVIKPSSVRIDCKCFDQIAYLPLHIDLNVVLARTIDE